MIQILRVLTVHSVKDLFKYRSFFALVLVLFFVDRIMHVDVHSSIRMPSYHDIATASVKLPHFVFSSLPGQAAQALFQWRTLIFIVGLFVVKQIISMWPSSDMRRMHRNEREGVAIFKALLILKWHQFLWDAMAVGILCGGAGIWVLLWFFICQAGWQKAPSMPWLWGLGFLVFFTAPLVLAGLSYSSKLAVLSKRGFKNKFRLFLALFTNPAILAPSWIFYLIRQTVEAIFVIGIPAFILLTVPLPWVRIPLAGMLATPVYAFLKMASFKFFLHVYAPYPEIREEYKDYYSLLKYPV